MCIVADLRDLAAAQRLLNDLPQDVFGQMYVSSDAGIWPLDVPERVQVSWLRPGPEVLATALGAWQSEWLTDEAMGAATLPILWVFPEAARQLTLASSPSLTHLVTVLPETHLVQGHHGVLPRALDPSVRL